MDIFDQCYDIVVKKIEKLYSNNPQDAGGETVWGIARNKHPEWGGWPIVDQLKNQGILIRTPSFRGVAEEAPGAYKDVSAVVDAADEAKLARKVARLEPLVCVKG